MHFNGKLGDGPDIKYSQNGDPIATFSLAFRLSKDKTGWVKVVCFNKTAEVAETYLHKGATILLSATLDYNQWETHNDIGDVESLFSPEKQPD